MSRRVEQLAWAAEARRVPFGPGRPRGAKALGVRYEKELARACPWARHGQWFEFVDRNGPGVCQTDLLFKWGDRVVVLEAKYTWVLEGHLQVRQLYVPVLEKVYGRGVVGLVVAKRLVPHMRAQVAPSLAEALTLASGGANVVWHWLGGTAVEAAFAAAA